LGYSEVSIYATGGVFKRKLGSYTRNYPAHGLGTWYPFSRGGKDYALYSRDYTSTRVMELPWCKDIGGEEPAVLIERDYYVPEAVWGVYCPVEYFVPKVVIRDKDLFPKWPNLPRTTPSDLAFVAGFSWGEPSEWEIQCLDLSQVESGIITRDQRFSYIAMPEGASLRDSVSLKYYEKTDTLTVTLPVMQTFDLARSAPAINIPRP
jgi:hypothetical protein